MLEKVFCLNIAPSFSSGNHLFHKVEYIGRSCLCQVVAKTFDRRPEISISELYFDNPFQGYPTFPPFMSPDTEHLAPKNSGAR